MTSDTSNTSNTSNSGSIGALGDGLIVGRPDLPFVTLPDGNGKELGDNRVLNPGNFADHRWSPPWFAWRVLAAVVQPSLSPNWVDYTSGAMTTAWNGGDPGLGADEITPLVRAFRDERSAALWEIVSQADNFIGEFAALLSITPISHPYTARLLHLAEVVGLFAAMYYKGQFNRPRPSHVAPALLPPIPVPGHSSFPSGHATQAHLMAQCVGAIFTRLSSSAGGNNWSTDDANVMKRNLEALALRIGRNREIAGLHFESDSKAGETLADRLFEVLSGDGTPLPVIQIFVDTLNGAVDEWRRV